MTSLVASFVTLIHVGVVVFITAIPMISKVQWPLGILHLTAVFSLLVHWIADNDICFLTLMESVLLGIPMKSSFMHRLVSPVFKITDKEVKRIVWFATPFLGAIMFYRLYISRNLIFRDIGAARMGYGPIVPSYLLQI